MADEGRKLVDKELRKLERELAKEYAKAQKEMQEKLDRRLRTFEALDAKKKKLLEQAKISQVEYDKWKKGQLLQSGWMKSMIEKYSSEQMKLNKKSADRINDRLQKVYADSYNFGTYQVEKNAGISTSFTLFNKNTVKRLLKDDPNLLPEVKIDESKDKRWNKQMMRSALTQGVLQGDGAKGIAKRLSDVTNMDKVSAIRNARTMTTGAENAGKLDSYYRAREMGIPVKKVWQSTLDERTRKSHRHLDGEVRELEEAFSNGLQYPGDVDSGVSGTEIYNCRCNLSSTISGFERDMTDLSRNNKLGDMSYDEWKNYTKATKTNKANNPLVDELNNKRNEILGLPPNKQALEMWRKGYLTKEEALKAAKDGTISKHVNDYYNEAVGNIKANDARREVSGTDISHTWKRRGEEFDFAIDDIVNAQGFDGLPKVVDYDEFQKRVNESGIICKRGYKASNGEILDEYHDQLLNGKWYIDCGGGSNYGRGMYSVMTEGTKLSERMNDTVNQYGLFGQRGPSGYGKIETFTMAKGSKIIDSKDVPQLRNDLLYEVKKRSINRNLSNNEEVVFKMLCMHPDADAKKASELIASGKVDINKMSQLSLEATQKTQNEVDQITRLDDGEISALCGYDALKARQGEGDYYLVVLNRTKIIFLRS